MPLPPTVIAIKRKLQDEPLDMLYVQNERSDNGTGDVKRRATEHSYKFIRVRSDQDATSRPVFPPLKRAAGTEGQRNDLPSISLDNASNEGLQSTKSMQNSRKQPAPPSILAPRSSSPRPRAEPRRFLLMKERLAGSSGRQSPRSGVQKRKVAGRNELAVFSEQLRSRASALVPSNTRGRETALPGEPGRRRELRPQDSMSSLKRPGVTAQERKWREETWRRTERSERSRSPLPPTKPLPLTSAEESLRLAATLQQFALEATLEQKDAQSINGKEGVHQSTAPNEPDADVEMGEDDGDYVYDQYIRQAVHAEGEENASGAATRSREGAEGPAQPDKPVDQGLVGYLIIREQDEADWAALGDAGDSDSEEGDEDDVDSNAESFYGNDYPEDELSSDDEVGRGAYNYRKGHSSDEEYDLTNDAWSDEEQSGDPKANPFLSTAGTAKIARGNRGGAESDAE